MLARSPKQAMAVARTVASEEQKSELAEAQHELELTDKRQRKALRRERQRRHEAVRAAPGTKRDKAFATSGTHADDLDTETVTVGSRKVQHRSRDRHLQQRQENGSTATQDHAQPRSGNSVPARLASTFGQSTGGSSSCLGRTSAPS
jgi:hypothetical protein